MSYDSFGNRTFENFSGDLVSQSAPPIPASTWEQYNAKNQVQSSSSGAPTYDASGNVTQDTQNQYLYDAEGRICAVHDYLTGQMMEYLYDAEGNRVAKGTIASWSCDTTQNGFTLTESDVLDPSGRQLTELSWSGGTAIWAHTNVWATRQLIAIYSANGSQTVLNFELADWLAGLGRDLTFCQRGAGAAAYATATANVAQGGKWTAGPGSPTGAPANDNGMPDYGDQATGMENQSVIAGFGYAQWQKACGKQ